MKSTLLKFSALLVFLMSFSLTALAQNQLKDGFYFLADSDKPSVIISDIDSDERFAVDPTELLTIEHFVNAKFVVKVKKTEEFRVIELSLNKQGKKNWLAVKRRMSANAESIVFICNDKIYVEKRFGANFPSDASIIEFFVDRKYQQEILDILKAKIAASAN